MTYGWRGIAYRKPEVDAGVGRDQICVWRLPRLTHERPHGLKYSLFYGRPGERIICYDNEAGKGDHRHYRDREEAYAFVSLEKLIADFEADVRREIENE
jgi:hypothetical protein